MKILPFTGDGGEAVRWDEFVSHCHNANFLHSRRFLSYHGDRFVDRSVWLENDKGAIAGVFPAAVSPTEATVVCSHPGATYGGIAHAGKCGGSASYDAIISLCEYYRAAGFRRLVYKAVPHIYHRYPSEDDVSALFDAGAKLISRKLSVAIAADDRRPLNKRRLGGFRKCPDAPIEVINIDNPAAATLWKIIEQNTAVQYRTTPTHRWDEIQLLAGKFPQDILCVVGSIDNTVEAGTLIFRSPTVWHTQYIGASDIGRQYCLLDVVLLRAIKEAQAAGCWFSFGTSSEDKEGKRLNAGLHRFKSDFGGGGVVYDRYQIDLD